MPAVIVARMGVFVLSLIPVMNLKSRPSSAMAQMTRGMGNMAPSRLPREMEKTNHAMQKRDTDIVHSYTAVVLL